MRTRSIGLIVAAILAGLSLAACHDKSPPSTFIVYKKWSDGSWQSDKCELDKRADRACYLFRTGWQNGNLNQPTLKLQQYADNPNKFSMQGMGFTEEVDATWQQLQQGIVARELFGETVFLKVVAVSPEQNQHADQFGKQLAALLQREKQTQDPSQLQQIRQQISDVRSQFSQFLVSLGFPPLPPKSAPTPTPASASAPASPPASAPTRTPASVLTNHVTPSTTGTASANDGYMLATSPVHKLKVFVAGGAGNWCQPTVHLTMALEPGSPDADNQASQLRLMDLLHKAVSNDCKTATVIDVTVTDQGKQTGSYQATAADGWQFAVAAAQRP